MSFQDDTWFEVASVADIVDESGVTIGQLHPGERFRAEAVEDLHLVVPRPGGVLGRVARSAVLFDASDATGSGSDSVTDQFPRTEPAHPTAPHTVITPNEPAGGGAGTMWTPGHRSEAPPPPAVPAGWLPDPERPEMFVRYWDGASWTGERAPAPPASATASSMQSPAPPAYGAAPNMQATAPPVEAERPVLGGRSLARVVGAIVVLWSGLSIGRVAALTNGWGDDSGYGLTDDENPWWFATSLWWQFYGELASEMEDLFAPGGSVLASPLWMYTALVGLLGAVVLIIPRKGARWGLLVVSALHLIAGLVIGYNGDFANESINTLLRASLVPLLTVLCLGISIRQRSPISAPIAPGSP